MVQAAARSGIDFRTVDFLGRHDWLRLNWILDQLEDESTAEIARAKHQQNVGVLPAYVKNEQGFKQHWDAANDGLKELYRLFFPWVKEEDQGDKRRSEYEALMEQWRKIWGDSKDPKNQARFKRIADAIRRRGEESAKSQFSDSRKLSERLRRMRDRRLQRQPATAPRQPAKQAQTQQGGRRRRIRL
jgi:hypothetical protein